MESYVWGILILIIIFVVIGIIIYYLYFNNPAIAPASLTKPLSDNPLEPLSPGAMVDCDQFGHNIGAPACKTGTQGFTLAGNTHCYKDVWSAQGGTKTAICTIDWGTYGGVVTRCGIGIYDLNIGDPCPMVGPGYYKTAVCTCQFKGVITSSQYCQSESLPDQCPAGSDLFAGNCYARTCPTGFKRTARCVCSPNNSGTT